MDEQIQNTSNFKLWIKSIKDKIHKAQNKAFFKVNEEMLTLYWEIGNSIIDVQKNRGWGAQIIDNLSKEIKENFPNSTGFSVRNLKYMRAFAKEYPDYPNVQVSLAQNNNTKVQVPLAQITWYHHISLLTKVKDINERAFYIIQTAINEWSRDVMLLQIKSDLYNRSGRAINNFTQTLPKPQSDLAHSIFKDPYNFDFLSLTKRYNEKDMEIELTKKITDFLLELGKGFAFVGKQYEIEVDNSDYRIDLLFYHINLHSYVVVELKIGEFKPEFISKLNFYISAVDDNVKTEVDNNTIGLLLCASKSNIKVEYAMRGFKNPIGVAAYELEQIIKEKLNADNDQ